VLDNLTAEEQLEADARKLLMDHAKQIKDSRPTNRQLSARSRRSSPAIEVRLLCG